MASEAYIFVVSSHDPISDEVLDKIVAEEPELSSWHRSAYVPTGKFLTIPESRLGASRRELAHA